MMNGDPLRTLAEFGAQIGGRSARTVQRIIERDSIPTYRINNSRMIRQSDIDIWIEAHRVEETEQAGSLKALVARAVQRAREKARKVSLHEESGRCA